MSTVKSFAVGNGDMFYIAHNTDNFSIIDCCLSDDNKERIVDEIISRRKDKGITRFISTHPDADHFRGIEYLDRKLSLVNFYCLRNSATKEEKTDDFLHYCGLRDDPDKAFYIKQGSIRRWMNKADEERKHSGIHVHWPDRDNRHFKEALEIAEDGGSPNNISAVIRYSVKDGGSFLWMGDLETDFMEKIATDFKWPKTDIVFAAHHGRYSGRIPHSILDQLKPKIIVLGEAPSRHLNYYGGYDTLTQNSAGDLTFECYDDKKVHIFASEAAYTADFLDDEDVSGEDYLYWYSQSLNFNVVWSVDVAGMATHHAMRRCFARERVWRSARPLRGRSKACSYRNAV
jgi:beta-lactamase superfamily II metal-dependent hydrolase